MDLSAHEAALLVDRMVGLLRQTGQPVVLVAADGKVEVGVLSTLDLTEEDYFLLPAPVETLIGAVPSTLSTD